MQSPPKKLLLGLHAAYNEKQLLRLITQGDEQAFTQLFNQFKNKIFSLSVKLTGSVDVEEDIVQEIEVLGTSFNINIYDDEPIKKTTLITGSIKITHNNQVAILQPGQQANIPIIPITKIKQITVQTTNIEQTLAWKNGFFNFTSSSLEEVMRQLSHWYNIEVQYQGSAPRRRLQGELPRSLNLSQILVMLTEMQLKYTLNGRVLTISE